MHASQYIKTNHQLFKTNLINNYLSTIIYQLLLLK